MLTKKELLKIDTICFDMDGTLADLYNFENWLPMLRNEENIFNKLSPMVDIAKLGVLLLALKSYYDVRVISWLPMNATKEYKKTCRNDKIAWIKENRLKFKHIHLLQYGSKKHYVKGITKNALIFDDNFEVRKNWEKSGRLAATEENILETLMLLLEIKIEE